MSFLFNEIFLRPLFNLLVSFYNLIPGQDFGLAIILVTVIIRLIFVPLSIKSLLSQRELSRLQPKLKELQEKYKQDRQALGQATMALYKEHGINPLSGCLPLLIQLPVLFALYQALVSGFKPESLGLLYSFVDNTGPIKEIAFGFVNIAKKNSLMAITAAVLQWFQLKQAAKLQAVPGGQANSTAQQLSKQMLYFMPIVVIIIAWNLPAGLVLYWIVTTVFSIFEQYHIARKYK